ncbi:arylamine N-acetyltransferase [Actinokineospora diospyrosa]|uniref:arylamine N-acetyltransferase n=1 Tax=Actinokineospora diospyrosa TaxID=103728 RepID=UPI0027E36145|nr:arylamine N-acetyltransferase [Actinokineospora diospyrosa]
MEIGIIRGPIRPIPRSHRLGTVESPEPRTRERCGHHGLPRRTVADLGQPAATAPGPFETLAMRTGSLPGIDPAASVERIARLGRGGYCFHLNGAFGLLLGELGYRVTAHRAWVWKRGHLALSVAGLPTEQCPDERWPVEVAPHEPIPLEPGSTRQDRSATRSARHRSSRAGGGSTTSPLPVSRTRTSPRDREHRRLRSGAAAGRDGGRPAAQPDHERGVPAN